VALVTGGARRVGRAICLALAGRGCDVVLTRNTSAPEAEATAREIESAGVDARIAPLDLADAARSADWGRAIAGELPRLDVLVHSASTYDPSPLDGLDLAHAEAQLRVNALSPLALSAALAPLLARSPLRGGGAIVAMLDIHAAGLPRRDHAAYAMSKAALGAMMRTLALELAPSVRVNGVAPGVVAWPESGPEADPTMQERYLSRVPLGRAGTPEEAASAVAFLALDATYTTGAVLRVDGGRSLR
ncbi:MAG TPA: SDR family oxidoreductase, partial [Phycisphaerales bacterium]|nr:SDR family oxidoreductase [Phycisphaerales bacterium]